MAPVLDTSESLSLARLKGLLPSGKQYKDRPASSFLELMEWTEKNFTTGQTRRLVNNRIIIDGLFVAFAESKGINISCLYQDSILSWRTESNEEKFFVQGVFKISWNDHQFTHCALFHKGNQNEDEISFFILVDDKNYEAYLSLRNEFDDWVKVRDRHNGAIRVVDGQDLTLTSKHSWDELFLPSDQKNKIKRTIETFLASKDFYTKHKMPWKRGMLFFGQPGNGKSSLIRTIVSNYAFKAVTIASGSNTEAVIEAFSYAEEQSPSLLYLEDLNSMLQQHVDLSTFLNLMDGVQAKNGLFVIATTNDVKSLPKSITQRPSRFDEIQEISLPDEAMCLTYLTSFFGTEIPKDKLKGFAKKSFNNELSFAYLKEFYISSMYEALANGRKTLKISDVESSFKKILSEKAGVAGNKISTTKYTEA